MKIREYLLLEEKNYTFMEMDFNLLNRSSIREFLNLLILLLLNPIPGGMAERTNMRFYIKRNDMESVRKHLS